MIAGAKGPSQVFRNLTLGSAIPRVHVSGFVPDCDLPALYSGATALAYVSLYEGFGLPVLEGMACGTVPIAAENTALPELVGDAGLLVDPFDCNAIATGIEAIMQNADLRRTLRTRAIDRSKHFSWERAAARTWRVIRKEAQAADCRIGYRKRKRTPGILSLARSASALKYLRTSRRGSL